MYRYTIVFIFSILFCSTNLRASHIVGGEIELRYAGTDNLYHVFMNMYYDDLNAEAGLFDVDQLINVSIFSKATNIRQKNIQLIRTSTNLINNTTNGCDDPTVLKTRTFRYRSLKPDGNQGPIDLSGLVEPQGYYIAWERCCRNYQTINIIHQNFSGIYISGQAFYTEFPPISKNGSPFINSSPHFIPVTSQYLCRNNLIQIDFSATDIDGDSLSYQLVTPLKGHTTEFNSQPLYPESAPYDPISWNGGFSVSNAIPGSPALYVNQSTGVLTVNPGMNGLFAFAVACSEFRNGVKIGEVRRDFQYLVKDCPIAYPPSVGLQKPSGTNWSGTTNPDTLYVKLNKDTCYTIFVTDSSANFYNTDDYVNISYGKTTLPSSVISFSPARVLVTPTSDTTSLNMCFSTCDKLLIEQDGLYFLDILVKDGDDATCNRKTDTLRTYIRVDVEETNSKPIIGTTLDPQTTLTTYPDTLTEFYVYGLDIDAEDLRSIVVDPFRFKMEDYRMAFSKVYHGTDSIAYKFSWTPSCFDLRQKTEFKLDFILRDKSCIYTHSDTTRITLLLEDADTELRNLIPSNLITPNGDGLNDCFHLPNIPPDNCTYIFKSVELYNRWGARIYKSSDRNFVWCPDKISDGIYYYSIDLNAKTIKGWLQIIR